MDDQVAYTKLDGEKTLRGNPILRGQVKFSLKTLGYCTPLALKTKGKIQVVIGKKNILKRNFCFGDSLLLIHRHCLFYPAEQLCLLLSTSGTVFNGKKLQNKREKIVNTFARVFGRRIAQAAEPPPCHSCYCAATKDGTGLLKCLRCDYQRPSPYNAEVSPPPHFPQTFPTFYETKNS